MNNYYKIKGGGGCLRFVPSRQISPLSLLKYGLTAPKIAEICYFGINLPKRGIPPQAIFFTKFGLGKGLPGLHPHVKFYRCGFKNVGLQTSKSQKNGNFWYIFAPNGYIPLSNYFNKIWRGEGLPRPHNHANFHFCGFKIVALWPPKSPKIAFFGINLPARKNLGRP